MVASKRGIDMETLRDILKRISDCGLAMDLTDRPLDSHSYEASRWLEAFEADSEDWLDWPAKLIGEHQIQFRNTDTGRWIFLFL